MNLLRSRGILTMVCLTMGWSLIAISSSCSSGTARSEKKTSARTSTKVDVNQLMDDAMQAYRTRQYDRAQQAFLKAIKETTSKSTLIKAHKHLAFIYAIQSKPGDARQKFMEVFELDHDFELDKAEEGNPYWTPSFMAASREAAIRYGKGGKLLNLGKEAYEKRSFDDALRYLEAASDKEDLSSSRKAEAFKFLAFIHAINKNTGEAKKAFRMAFRHDKKFVLDKAEYGNPLWTPLYDAVKKEIKQ